MFGYRVPAPDEAMLISGGRRGLGGAPFRVVTGHGKFVLPIFRKTRFLTLSMCESEVTETCVTRQGISLHVRAVIAFKFGNDPESVIDDGDTGYIDAMSAPHKAAIQRQAQIAQAQATQASVEAEQVAARNQAEYARQTAIVKAEYSAEVERAQAKAAQAGPLAQAHAQ